MTILPRTSGIYQILCVPTGKVYIGSAVNLRQRHRDHLSALRNNTHANRYLQRAWNKYGADAFEFSVLEMVEDKKSLLVREQAWMDNIHCCDRNVGYNISPTAGSLQGVVVSEQRKKRIGLANSKMFEGFIDPDGNEVSPIQNLTAFCREHGLLDQAMHEVYRGVRVSYKGWTHRNYPRKPHGLSKTYCGFVNPDGMPIGVIHGLSAFCRQHGLSQAHMQAVHAGNRPHHKGWTCVRSNDDF